MTDELIREFLAKLAAERPDLAPQPRPSGDEPIVRDLWKLWEPTVAKSKDARVRASAKPKLLDLGFGFDGVETCLGDLPWSRCDPRAVMAWWGVMAKIPTIRRDRVTGGRKLPEQSTGDRMIAFLRACFTYHADPKNGQRIPKSPLEGMGKMDPSGKGARQGYYSEEKFAAWAKAAHPLLAKMGRLSFRVGGIRREVVRLLDDHEVDWATNELVFRALRAKNGKAHRVLLTADMVEMLKAQFAAAPMCDSKKCREAGRHPPGVRHAFPNPRDPDGGPVPVGTIDGWIRKTQRRCGFDLFGEAPTFHHQRHSWATHMLIKGAPISWVAEQGNWKLEEMVARYGHLVGEARERMRSLMDAHVADLVGERYGPQASEKKEPPPIHKKSVG